MPRGRTRSSKYSVGPRRNKLGWRNKVRAPEIRHKTTNTHGGSMTGTILKGTLCQIEAGTGRDQRTGNSVRLLNVRGFGRVPVSYGSTRLIIYIPKSTDDTLSLVSPHDAVNPEQFHVLYDKYWLPYNDAGNTVINYNISFGPNGKIVKYDGSLASGYITPTVKYYLQNNDRLGEAYLNSITTFSDE